ncbi:MAG: carboxynorspermidine decarboxylase [Verrucomicrobiota bacterium]|nr:carboxynorspermidine decarboxylase [Verrucomicrobiota bacterium]
MQTPDIERILAQAPSPCFVVHEGLLQRNLDILNAVQERAGCKILLALKGFAMWSLFPHIRETLQGCCASGPIEARLGREVFNREVHTFAAAFSEADIRELTTLTDHIVFNSFSQWERFQPILAKASRPIEVGLRVNPEVSTAAVAIYDPCAPGSRLGILREAFAGKSLEGISGLHFHTLCEQNSDALEQTLNGLYEKFGDILKRDQIRWLNMGGGHHITREDYDTDRLVRLIHRVKEQYGVEVYMEPGEAVALNTGFLIATVLDIVHNAMDIAILDTSATCHMPDVLEMPYRPKIELEGVLAGEPGQRPHTYRLGGLSCLAGDVIGDYSFTRPLQPGDRLVFHDMGHYSMVKTTTFNGVRLPTIASYDPALGAVQIKRTFGYEDYKTRLS